ncbi:uncharacterized protein PSFLO_00316 [Pseudozyma flocculosa]|uniref:Uncharacterized protein n=1 Tax=Pseudozyma flocculosa TaxID=84751 RepID=A0A5C3ET42_9BASI|nr:uncharacterized protein PSFLO_00316 [Pseudozyma flocculosa]
MVHPADIPDEPPPAYEAIAAETGSSTAAQHLDGPNPAAAPAAPSIAPQRTGASTNPFLSIAEGGTASSPSASSNPLSRSSQTSPPATAASPVPELPPRRYNSATGSTTSALSPHATARPGSVSAAAHRPAEPTSPGSLASSSRPASFVSPNGSAYQPPPGRPPPSGPPAASSPTSPQSASRPPARPQQNQYRPTTAPTPGQPLLRNGKLLVYPKSWTGCHKCGDTGYKHGDPTHPCRKCWDKYGKTFSGALSYSVGLNDPTFKLQKPLPIVHAPAVPHHTYSSGFGPPVGGGWPSRPSHGYVPGGYPGATGGGPWSPPPHQPPYGYPSGPYSAPPRPPPPQQPAVQRSDAETEASRMPDAPPTYTDASNVGEHERLPAQYVPPAAPPPGAGPAPMHSPPPHGPPGGYPQSPPGAGPGYGYGYGPHPPQHQGMGRPVYVNHSGRRPPPGALVVMPGDPRIGGRLCFECGGRGMTESFWFGDETCFRCRGSGRIL